MTSLRQRALGLRAFKPRVRTPHATTSIWLIVALLTLQTKLVPLPWQSFALQGDLGAMTEGCETATCCTSRCFVDRDGVHHCMPKPGDSCECGVSDGDSHATSALPETLATFAHPQHLLPSLLPAGWVFANFSLFDDLAPVTPTPPPRTIPS